MKKMLLPLVLLGCVGGAVAQDKIFRCGNEYTNNATVAKERGCKPIEGGHVTVIHGSPAAAAPAAGNRGAAAAASSPAGAPKVDAQAQRARDADARSILQAELAKSQERLAALKAEYNNGSPERTALELRNPQGYLERTATLKANIERQESDIAGIQRELARLPNGS